MIKSLFPLPPTGEGRKENITKGNLCSAFTQKGEGHRVPPASVSQLPSVKIIFMQQVAYFGVAYTNLLSPLMFYSF